MRSHSVLGVAVLLALLLSGCGRTPPQQVDVAPEDSDTRLGEAVDIRLDAWLQLPRKELARLDDEWAATVRAQLDSARKAPDTVELLPRLHAPLSVPVYQEARYSALADLTLPEYAAAGQPDAALALHVARFGDHQAAVKLAPDDKALRAQIDALKGSRNYPVEWTRLVARVLQSAEQKVATGDPEGATHLVLLHKQLTKLLDARAQAGPLGAALLPAGRRALEQAARAWRDGKRNKTALAGDIEKALADWGQLPSPNVGLPLGASREALSGAFGPSAGQATVLHQPPAVARALDLLALPVPRDGARVVAGFFEKDKLVEVLVAYRPKIDTLYPTTGHLAYHLDERGYSGKPEVKNGSLQRQAWAAGEASWDIVRTDRSGGLGAVVRLSSAEQQVKAAPGERSPRDLGAVNLDNGFEATRVDIAPDQPGPLVSLKQRAALERLGRSLELPTPAEGMLERVKKLDVIGSLRLIWAPEQNGRALVGLLPGLWTAYGSAMPEAHEGAGGGYLGFTWERDRARVQLRLPFNDSGPVLVAEDKQPEDQQAARSDLARQRDAQARQGRLRDGSARVLVPRSPGHVNDFSLDALQLGQARADALAALPSGASFRVKDWGKAVSVVILTAPPKGAPYWARQVIVRFDEGEKVSEVRIRYHEAQSKTGPSLASSLNVGKAGAPEALAPEWPSLWTNLPRTAAPAVYQRWQDDRTVRTYQRDAWGAEVVLRDRPTDDAVPAPLVHVGRGVNGAALGASRSEVRSALKGPAKVEQGAEIYGQPASSQYEAVFVYYEGDRVTRVLALHRDKVAAGGAQKALQTAYGRQIDKLGSVRRQEGPNGSELGAMFWFDDQVRVKTYAHQGPKDARLYTEWRTWPVR